MASQTDTEAEESNLENNEVLVVRVTTNTKSETDAEPLTTTHPEVEAQSFSEILINAANTGNIHPEKFSETIANSHRYLQQQIYDYAIKPTIKKLAENNSDRRNETAVSECEEIVNKVFNSE